MSRSGNFYNHRRIIPNQNLFVFHILTCGKSHLMKIDGVLKKRNGNAAIYQFTPGKGLIILFEKNQQVEIII